MVPVINGLRKLAVRAAAVMVTTARLRLERAARLGKATLGATATGVQTMVPAAEEVREALVLMERPPLMDQEARVYILLFLEIVRHTVAVAVAVGINREFPPAAQEV